MEGISRPRVLHLPRLGKTRSRDWFDPLDDNDEFMIFNKNHFYLNRSKGMSTGEIAKVEFRRVPVCLNNYFDK